MTALKGSAAKDLAALALALRVVLAVAVAVAHPTRRLVVELVADHAAATNSA